MAERSGPPALELRGARALLWGADVRPDIFRRWAQGFRFGPAERTALEQAEGGPCAIIAAVQAFLVKNLLLEHGGLGFREGVTESARDRALATALAEILCQCGDESDGGYRVACPEAIAGDDNGDEDAPLDPARFHAELRVRTFDRPAHVLKYYLENVSGLKARHAVLSFLYSVILTRGLQRVRSECDSQEPLIDDTYGYGSQSVINLMLTGRATTYVWDHDQDVGGLKLRGIEKQNQVGFITVMEYHRFCTVGSFYKNPIHPVWVVGSDTHLTVLFSDERRLVSPETKSEQARRVFKSFDPDGNNFIGSDRLRDVLEALDLVSDPEYVNIMKKKLDGEMLGIILLNAFMEEFFPKEEYSAPDVFTLVHYNGLAQSNVGGQVRYHVGSAILLESEIKSVCESNPMLTVLQTKWPTIEVNWCDGATPSLN